MHIPERALTLKPFARPQKYKHRNATGTVTLKQFLAAIVEHYLAAGPKAAPAKGGRPRKAPLTPAAATEIKAHQHFFAPAPEQLNLTTKQMVRQRGKCHYPGCDSKVQYVCSGCPPRTFICTEHHQAYHLHLQAQSQHNSPADDIGADSGEEQVADALLALASPPAALPPLPAPAAPAPAQSPPQQQRGLSGAMFGSLAGWLGYGKQRIVGSA